MAIHGIEIKLTISHGEYQYNFRLTKGTYTYDITLSKWPTGNCQLSSLGLMNYVFVISQERKVVQDIIKELYVMARHAPKLILLDVRNEFVAAVEKCFKVKIKQPYVSTNATNMCLFVVELDV